MFRRRPQRARPKVSSLSHLFHGIAVNPGPCACEAVAALGGQRFLSDEAPRLPLPGCSRPEDCRCVYRHFTDRRTDARRDSDVGLPQRQVAVEKRSGRGRRITD